MSGTTQPGERMVLITEAVFDEFVELVEKRDGKEVTVEWGGPTHATTTFFTPTIWVTQPDADPLTVGQG